MKNKILLLLLLASLAGAASVDEFARTYLKPGESMALSNFSSGGVKYTLVKINGELSVLLKPANSGFEAVSDATTLSTALGDYASSIFTSAVLTSSYNSARSSYDQAYPTLSLCLAASNTFMKLLPMRYVVAGRTPLQVLWLLKRNEKKFKNELAAINAVNSTIPLLNNTLANANSSLDDFKQGVDKHSLNLAVSSASALLKTASSLKTFYSNLSSAYNTLNTSKGDLDSDNLFSGATFADLFRTNGKKQDCTYNASIAAALAKIENELTLSNFKTAADLATQVSLATADRTPQALLQQYSLLRTAKLSKAGQDAKKLVDSYYAVSVALKLSAFLEKQASLSKSFDNIKIASTSDAAKTKATEFDNALQEFEKDIPKYEKILPDYQTALASYANASSSLATAQKRYGSADERVAEMSKQLKTLKITLESNEDRLSRGLLSALEFKGLTLNATALSVAAITMQPKESVVDPTILGGVFLLLFVLAGTVWYLKKMKNPAPPKEIGLQPQNEKQPFKKI